MAGKQVSVYIGERDAELWERATAYAHERRLPMSQLVMLALERFLDSEAPAPGKGRRRTDGRGRPMP